MNTLVVVALLHGVQLHQADFERVTLQRATSAVTIDGRLADAAWEAASPISLPFEVRPRSNVAARVRTECRATFDDHALYFGCEASDDPRNIRAYLTDRDRIGHHDRIVLFIDPFADARRAFFFNVNPLGVQQDGIFNGLDGSADLAWDAVWESAGRVTDSGYTVEMAIPFGSIRFPTGAREHIWRFFVERNWPRSENVVLRSTRLDQSNACNLCQSDELAGLVNVVPGLGIQINPTLTFARTDRRNQFPTGNVVSGPVDAELGLTGRVRVTQDLRFSSTINPDFSQVEADVAQLDVNEQFSLLFPEKRPFYLDGTDVLQTPIRAAFTRTIADPVAGASLNGKLGPVLLSSLASRDERTVVLVPGNQGSGTVDLDRRTTDFMQRARIDVGGTGAAGVLYTGRFADAYSNQLIGADGFFRLTPLLRIQTQVLHSVTRDPTPISDITQREPNRFSGNAVYAQLQRSDWGSRTGWFGSVTAMAKSPEFRADAGFEPQVDVRRIDADVAWNTWSDGADWFTRINYWIGGHRSETFGGRLNSEDVWAWVSYNGPRQTFFWIWPRWGRQFFAGDIFRLNYWEFSLSTQPLDPMSAGLDVRVGDEIDFANARGANGLRVSPNVTFRAGRHWDVNIQHRFQRLTVGGSRLFTANLTQARTVYNFSSRAFLRGILQYRHTGRDPSLYVASVDRVNTNLLVQMLFSYRVNARTGLFLGYADNRAGTVPESDPRVPLMQTDRTFFLKVGYAWQR